MNHESSHSVHAEIVDWVCGEILDNGVTKCHNPVKFKAKISDVQPCFIHECRDGHTHILEKKYPLIRFTAFPGSQIVYGEIEL